MSGLFLHPDRTGGMMQNGKRCTAQHKSLPAAFTMAAYDQQIGFPSLGITDNRVRDLVGIQNSRFDVCKPPREYLSGLGQNFISVLPFSIQEGRFRLKEPDLLKRQHRSRDRILRPLPTRELFRRPSGGL
mgnify:CR=1 FL=1